MPVWKYKTLEEMNRHQRQWLPTGDPSIPRKVTSLWKVAEALIQPVGLCIPRGVRKYRSHEEANADRDSWETERVQRLRAYRGAQRKP
jgi:hypothetical protein